MKVDLNSKACSNACNNGGSNILVSGHLLKKHNVYRERRDEHYFVLDGDGELKYYDPHPLPQVHRGTIHLSTDSQIVKTDI